MKGHILKYLEHHQSVKRKELLAHLHSLGVETNDRQMRIEVENLVKEGFCISSSSNGYKMIRTVEDLQEAKRYLAKKAFPLFKRIDQLEKNFDRTHVKSLFK
jgi:hypothetical protein